MLPTGIKDLRTALALGAMVMTLVGSHLYARSQSASARVASTSDTTEVAR